MGLFGSKKKRIFDEDTEELIDELYETNKNLKVKNKKDREEIDKLDRKLFFMGRRK